MLADGKGVSESARACLSQDEGDVAREELGRLGARVRELEARTRGGALADDEVERLGGAGKME